MSKPEYQNLTRVKKHRKILFSSSPNTSFDTLISDPKPAFFTELNELENKGNKSLTKELYLNAQQLFFYNNNTSVLTDYKIVSIIVTNHSELLIATDHGQIGLLNRNDFETKWMTITRVYPYDDHLEPKDILYDEDKKSLIDLCVDDKNQLIVLTKFICDDHPNEFMIEIYSLDESRLVIKLIKTFDLLKILSIHLLNGQAFEFTKIYYDYSLELVVLIDEMNHKVYWCNPYNFQAKKSVSSLDSIYKPNSIAIIEGFGFYLSSQKGIVLRRTNQEAVLHEVPIQSSPIDIYFSAQDQNVYFIDKFNLFRTRIVDSDKNQLRYKRIFSNHESLNNKNGFSRVIRHKDWFYLLVKDGNSIISLHVNDLF